ncbi:MAG: hypothetical protein L3J04_09855 [Robiginitomaculum sp.]|nr:hypothetical protein [Robiginitomaculum sp.]
MRTLYLAGASLLVAGVLIPSTAFANPNIRSEASIAFPESDRNAAKREANRERRSESRQRQQQRQQQREQQRSQPAPRQRSHSDRNRQPRMAGGDAPIIGYNPVIPDESGRNHRNRDRSRDRNRNRDHAGNGRNRDRSRDRNRNRDHAGNGRNRDRSRDRNRNRDHAGNGRNRDRSRDRNRDHARDHRRNRDHARDHRRNRDHARGHRRSNSRYYSGRPHRSNLNLLFSFGTTGYGNYGSRYGFGYGRNYGRAGHLSFLGGNYYQSSYDLYPWWYGDSRWGYRTRSNYRLGYGHIGHSNVYCTDPYHQSYGLNWNTRYLDRGFSLYSNTTNGSYGGYAINSCYLENRRGNFGRRQASIRVTVCWDDYSRQYVETGAVQLINYF